MKKIILLFSFVFLSISLTSVHAADYGLSDSVKFSGFSQNDNVYTMVGTVIKVALSVVAIVFFAFIFYAGIRWMTARGDEAFVKKAQQTIEGAIIGLVIVSISYGLTVFIFNRLGVQGTSQSGGGGGIINGNPAPAANACSDGIKDSFETDIDCGGKCNPCAEGKFCIKNIDCVSVNCQANKCSCMGSDFECGGECSTKCGIGRKCTIDVDCVSGKCVAGSCG